LPKGKRTTDREITEIASKESRIVISKDSDFVQSFWVTGQPTLLLLSTGNLSNEKLMLIFEHNLSKLVLAFTKHRFIEITQTDLIIHE
jgi:predicted nuclease of predicted toxin-antitoxin system